MRGAFLAGVAGVLLGVITGCSGQLVGFECREGFEACGGKCVDLSSSEEHCGACGNVCAAAMMCTQGSCITASDGGPADAPVNGPLDAAVGQDAEPDGEPSDGEAPWDGSEPPHDSPMDRDAGPSDAGPTDAGTPGDSGSISPCDIGEIRCGGECVRPSSDPANCGGCGVVCAGSEVCSAGACTASCALGLNQCGASCYDLTMDPDNCGGCGTSCASGVCRESDCSSGVPGHVVVIGHDYEVTRTGISRVVGNSVFLASGPGGGAAVRVLAYRGTATAASFDGTNAAVNQVATAIGRSWTRTETTSSQVPLLLDSSDVFVIYAQPTATDAELGALGSALRISLTTFLRRGGVVILLDGPGSSAGTWQVLDAAGLFSATSRSEITGSTTLTVVAPGDGIALSVPSPYRAESHTVSFASTSSGVVVNDGAAVSPQPVVFHRPVTP